MLSLNFCHTVERNAPCKGKLLFKMLISRFNMKYALKNEIRSATIVLHYKRWELKGCVTLLADRLGSQCKAVKRPLGFVMP